MSFYGTSIPDLLKRLETETGAAKANTYLYLAVEHKASDPVTALSYANLALEICSAENLKETEIDYWTVRAILEEGVSASEKAIEHLEKAVAIAAEIKDEQGRLTALQKIGLHKMRQHKTDEAGEILMRCVEDYKLLPDTLMKAECYHQTAQYLMNVDLKQAVEIALSGLAIAKNIGRPLDQVHHLKTLLNIAAKSGDDDKAIEYGLEALRIKEENNDQTALLGTARRIAHLYLKRNEQVLAQKYFEREVQLHAAPVNIHRTAQLQLEDAESYFYSGRVAEALTFAKQAINIATAENNLRKLGNAEFQMGNLLFLNKEFNAAIPYLEKSILTKGDAIAANDHIATLDLLHQCYEQAEQYMEAYTTLRKKSALEAELINSERIKEVTQLNKRYETEKREAELRDLKIKQQQTELERSESELKAIKAQMNPHFIFNALNSIQEMFFIGDKRLANEHLGKFSQLTREILKASGKQYITLSEEIEMLKKYLDLEGLRFEKDFSFSVTMNNEDAADDILLPPMLIQPYVENSIRHGLLHKQGGKSISIDFVFDEPARQLRCTVSDNGVGRKASSEINKGRKQLHESFSTSANAKRLELLNQNRDEKIGVEYEDLENGTKVVILIPVSYD
ncbi:MAG TPA: histidine kinase [Chitinophagales bacterium]|nr:histidine kinase [Chitinophagales bacterium]